MSTTTIWLDKINNTAQLVLGLIALFWVTTAFRNFILLDHESLFVGGLLSGGLHAMTGPDHLAALLPFIFGKKWYVSFAIGITWGIGHSLSTSLMGVVLYLLKDSLLKALIYGFISKFADLFVGFSLIIIGAIGFRELQVEQRALEAASNVGSSSSNSSPNSSKMFTANSVSMSNSKSTSANSGNDEVKTYDDFDKINGDSLDSSSHLGVQFQNSVDIEPHSGSVFRDNRAQAMSLNTPCGGLLMLASIFTNGFLLGLSWDSIPSLGPSIGAQSRVELFWFLVAYSASTAFAMALMTSLISVCSLVVGKYTETSDTLPHRLSLISCYVSLCLGVIWMAHGMLHCFASIDDEWPQMTWYILVISTISPISIVFVIVFTVLKHFGIWDVMNISSVINSRVKQNMKTDDASCNL